MASLNETSIKARVMRGETLVATRRVRLADPTFEILQKMARTWVKGGAYDLQYADDEGDVITMGSQEEWAECVQLWQESTEAHSQISLRPLPPVRLIVAIKAAKTKKATVLAAASAAEAATAETAEETADAESAPAAATETPEVEVEVEAPDASSLPSPDPEQVATQAAAAAAAVAEGRRAPEDALTVRSMVLDFLKREHGSDILQRLVCGAATPACLGCSAWLTVDLQGEALTLDIAMPELARELFQSGMDWMDASPEKARERFLMCTRLGATPAAEYNVACCAALLGNAEEAMGRLAEIVATRGASGMATDADLASLHGIDAFWELVGGRPVEAVEVEAAVVAEEVKEAEAAAAVVEEEEEEDEVKEEEVTTTEVVEMYAEQMACLREMGLVEESEARRLLTEEDGDLTTVLEKLLQ